MADRAVHEGLDSAIQIEGSADVAGSARLGAGTRIWHLAQICEGATLGRGCVVGRGGYVGPDVVVGDHVKIQNYALVYAPAELEDGVFIGPAVVLTNDEYPRAVRPDGSRVEASHWEPVGVTLREGCSVGARAVCVAPVEVGRWAMVAAGAVVVHDVPDFALVAGTPARRIGWVGPAGRRLEDEGGQWRCPVTGALFVESGGHLREAVDHD
jgi:UDP-2-acetamido-3-amino-2,3-dideoxy-glucuronate N-acetyltransferase